MSESKVKRAHAASFLSLVAVMVPLGTTWLVMENVIPGVTVELKMFDFTDKRLSGFPGEEPSSLMVVRGFSLAAAMTGVLTFGFAIMFLVARILLPTDDGFSPFSFTTAGILHIFLALLVTVTFSIYVHEVGKQFEGTNLDVLNSLMAAPAFWAMMFSFVYEISVVLFIFVLSKDRPDPYAESRAVTHAGGPISSAMTVHTPAP